MVRTQIQLTEQQARRVRARRRGVSQAMVIRECVEAGLGDEQPERQAQYERLLANFAGEGRDKHGATDLAENHDKYLDEAFS